MSDERAKIPPPDEQGSASMASPESEVRFRALVQAGRDLVYRMNPDWTELREFDGRGILVSAKSQRDWIHQYVVPDDRDRVMAAIGVAIATRQTFELEHRVWRADGSIGWALSRAVPVLDDHGNVTEWFGALNDVTAHHEARDALTRMSTEMAQQKRFYEALISATPDLVYAFDLEYRFMFANRALLEMWGRTFEDSIGKRLIEVGYEPWHAEMHEREIDQVLATRQGIRGEVRFPHATLGWRTYDYIFMPMFNGAGEVESIAGMTRDITDIKRTEEHLQLLVNELNHRVKNTLATIQSIARQTFRADAATAEARAAFEGRLIALSDVHTVLTLANWESANLADIVRMALAPFVDGSAPERLSVVGPDHHLRPQTSLALAMALHELASNAVKYGAWSNSLGRVDVVWTRSANGLRMEWREHDGPPVTQPTRRGFGTRLLLQGLVRELDGEVRLDYRREGLVCTVEMRIAEAA